MDTGLEYEGEAARKRFVVYWLRPGIAALAFGAFTFLVVSVPAEKEKIELRGEVQRLRAENSGLQSQLRGYVPFERAARAARPVAVALEAADGPARGRVLFDDDGGAGVVWVENLRAQGQRAFCWWVDADGDRTPLAAVPLDGSGYGHAQLKVPDARDAGGLEITLEALTGEPAGDGPAVLSASLD